MADLNADVIRFARYEKCRKKKSIIEKILGFVMAAAIILALCEVIPLAFSSIFGGLMLTAGLDMLAVTIVSAACMAAVIYAVYKRNWRITLAVLAAVIILTAAGILQYTGAFQPVPLTAALICDLMWLPLEKEEGFPLFQVPLNSHEAVEKARDYTIRKSAVESGARSAVSDTPADSDMLDLLDDKAETINAELKEYHERSRNADPTVHASENHSSNMDALENL